MLKIESQWLKIVDLLAMLMHIARKNALIALRKNFAMILLKARIAMADYNLKPCPFCGGDVCFDNAYSYFRDNIIYCNGCDMVFTLDDCSASDDDIARAWNRRADNG